jgi:hypothetical protein
MMERKGMEWGMDQMIKNEDGLLEGKEEGVVLDA